MKTIVAALAVLVATGASALATPATGSITFQVSSDGGASWSSGISVTPGTPFKVRALASWAETAGSPASIGFAGAVFEDFAFDGAAQSEFTGFAMLYKLQQGPPPEAWALYDIAGGVKIDRAVITPTQTHISVGQAPKSPAAGLPPNPDFSGANPIRVFEIDMTAGPGFHTIDILAALTTAGGTPDFRVYTSESGLNRKPVSPATVDGAKVDVVPGPGGLALLVVSGAAAGRRRRRAACG